jgi:hypothetical protein
MTPKLGIRCLIQLELGGLAINEAHIWGTNTSMLMDALPDFKNLFAARLALCGNDVNAVGGRLSVLGEPRNSYQLTGDDINGFVGLNAQNTTATPVPAAGTQPDQSKACITLVARSTSGNATKIYLAGVPDLILGGSNRNDIAPGQDWWRKLLAPYVNLLVTRPWGWSGISPPQKTFPTFQVPIAFGNAGANGLLYVVCTTLAGIAVPGQIQIGKVGRTNLAYTPANGVWTLTNVQADTPVPGQSTYTVANSAGVAGANQLAGTGYVGPYAKAKYAYASVAIDKQTTRKRGNRTLAGPARLLKRKLIGA